MGRRLLRSLHLLIVALAATALVAVAGVSSEADAATAPGTPNLALMTLAPADLGGAKVRRQGYVRDPAFVRYYEREFRSGAAAGGLRTLLLVTTTGLTQSARQATTYVASVRRYMSSKAGRQDLAKTILAGVGKDAAGSAKVTFGRVTTVTAGNQAFMARLTLTIGGVPFSVIIAAVRVDRAVQSITLMGSPGGKFKLAAVTKLVRAAAARMTTGLTPVALAPPTITGQPAAGQTLTALTGSWSNAPTRYTIQWESCTPGTGSCAPIAGATAATYVPTPSDVGRSLRVTVSATNGVATGAPATSAETAPVSAPPPPA